MFLRLRVSLHGGNAGSEVTVQSHRSAGAESAGGHLAQCEAQTVKFSGARAQALWGKVRGAGPLSRWTFVKYQTSDSGLEQTRLHRPCADGRAARGKASAWRITPRMECALTPASVAANMARKRGCADTGLRRCLRRVNCATQPPHV